MSKRKFCELTGEERKEVFTQAEAIKHISARAIEKDWWVTAVLRVLFSSDYKNNFVFKGGTSLSKGWHLIERFSEDIDIALDREFLGYGGKLTRTQISDKLRRAACDFVRYQLPGIVSSGLKDLGISEKMYSVRADITPVTTTDPDRIFIEYKSVFDDIANDYLKPIVVIEAGGRSISDPYVNLKINSIIDETFKASSFSEESFIVRTAPAERTFLEKMFLLHEEFHRQSYSSRTDRMSRHLYDLEKMMDTDIGQVIYDKDTYDSIIEHRKTFIRLSGFDYSSLNKDTIDFVPPDQLLKSWGADYEKMQEAMIYGETLPFSSLIERIKELNQRIKKS